MTTDNGYDPLPAMPYSLIRESLDDCQISTTAPWIQVFLTDGTEIAGCYGSLNEEHISLEHNEVSNEMSVLIPVRDIAGIASFSFSQDTIVLEDATADFFDEYPPGYASFLNKRLIEVARKRNYQIKSHCCFYCISPTKPFRWGPVSLKTSQVLYRDPKFLTQNGKGGARLEGATLFGFNLKIEPNLAKRGLNAIQGRPVPLTQDALENTALISGHLQFLEEVPPIELEGRQWIPASISSLPVSCFAELFHCSWKLVYFCEEYIQHPKNCWEVLKDPIRVFGEVIEQPFSTEHGSQPHFLKALVAGCIIPE